MSAGSADLVQLSLDLSNASGMPFQEAATELITNFAQQVQAQAQAMAPKKTMRLEHSIVITPGYLEATIGPTVAYGTYQEFGTATRGEFGGVPYVIVPVRAQTLAFKTKEGKWVFTKRVVHPGIPAHPFMRPALEQVVTPFGDKLADLGVLSITHGPKAALGVAA